MDDLFLNVVRKDYMNEFFMNVIGNKQVNV